MDSFHGKLMIVFLISIVSFAIVDASYYQSSIVSKEEVLYREHIFDLFMCQATLKVGLSVSTEWNISDVLGPNANTIAHLVGVALGGGISSPTILFHGERFIGSSLQVFGNIEAKQGGQCAIIGGTGEFTFAQGLLTYNLTAQTCWKLYINVLCPMPPQPSPPPTPPPSSPSPPPPLPSPPPPSPSPPPPSPSPPPPSPSPPPPLPSPPPPSPPPPSPPPPPPQASKFGPFCGNGGVPFDVSTPPQRLESMIFGLHKVGEQEGFYIDSIAFSYVDQDGMNKSSGPWGSVTSPTTTIQLGPSETVNFVSVTCGTNSGGVTWVTSLSIGTNIKIYGPFGNYQNNPTQFNVSANANESVVGFFGRAQAQAGYLPALGVYVL